MQKLILGSSACKCFIDAMLYDSTLSLSWSIVSIPSLATLLCVHTGTFLLTRLLQHDAPRGSRAPTRGSFELMYRSMLEHIVRYCLQPRSTVHVARAVMSEYPTLRTLFDAYSRCRSSEEAAHMLAGLKCLNGRTSRNIGPSLSTRALLLTRYIRCIFEYGSAP